MKRRRINRQTLPAPTHREAAPLTGGALRISPGTAFSGLTFKHPFQVLVARYLTKEDKRAILASWASDVWAVVSKPALRDFPGSEGPVAVADVLAALRALDDEPIGGADSATTNCSDRRLFFKPSHRMPAADNNPSRH
jgi:hypothetical protein